MSIKYQPISEIKKSEFNFDLFDKNQPVVIRGLVEDWPLVKASSSNIEDLFSYLCYYEGDRVLAFASSPESGNKFLCKLIQEKLFWNGNYTWFIIGNYSWTKDKENPSTAYMGSTSIDYVLPGLSKDNNFV